MSLLMEALRKAEEAKRRMQQEEQSGGTTRDAGTPATPAPPANNPAQFSLEDREDLTPDYIRENFTAAPVPGPASATPLPVEPSPPVATPQTEYTPGPEQGARNLARRGCVGIRGKTEPRA